MKKFILFALVFVFAFSLFNFNVNSTNAQAVSGCIGNYKFNPFTGQPCGTTTTTGCITGYLFNPFTGERCSASTSATSSILTIGSRGEDVRAIQQFLKNNSYSLGTIDGIYGLRTARAVSDFQIDNGLPVTGIVDAQTRAMLNSAGITIPTPPPTTQPSITVLSPNGGETWTKGTTQTIQWNTIGIPYANNMTIRLRSMSTGQELLTSNSLNTGYFLITIPSSFADGQYKAEVKTSINGQSYMDASNNSFLINSTMQPTSSLTITTPSPLPNAKVRNYYLVNLKFEGLNNPENGHTSSISGSLPPGLNKLDEKDLNILGTPTMAGVYNFYLTVKNATQTATKQFTLTVDLPTTQTSSTLSVFPSSLTFTGVQDGASPAYKLLSVTAPIGNGYSISEQSNQGNWLSVPLSYSNNNSGSAESVYVYVNTYNLPAGIYIGTISISGNFTNSPKTVPVTLTVTAPTTVVTTTTPAATLNLSANSYTVGSSFTLNMTSNQPANTPFYLCSNFTASSAGTGVSHTNRCITSPLYTYSSGGYSWSGTWDSSVAGSWTEWVKFGAYTSPTITFTVTAPPVVQTPNPTAILSTFPTSFSFTAVQGGANPQNRAVTITNSGNAEANWSAVTPSWLSIQNSGQNVAIGAFALAANSSLNLVVTADITNRVAGSYSDYITFSGNFTGSPKTIPVTLTVTAPVVIPLATSASLALSVWRPSIGNYVYSNFHTDDVFTLYLISNQPNTPFQLCSNLTGCITAGPTNSSGRLSWSGTWDSSHAGNWTEWVEFGSYTSPTINFTISAITAMQSNASMSASVVCAIGDLFSFISGQPCN